MVTWMSGSNLARSASEPDGGTGPGATGVEGGVACAAEGAAADGCAAGPGQRAPAAFTCWSTASAPEVAVVTGTTGLAGSALPGARAAPGAMAGPTRGLGARSVGAGPD